MSAITSIHTAKFATYSTMTAIQKCLFQYCVDLLWSVFRSGESGNTNGILPTYYLNGISLPQHEWPMLWYKHLSTALNHFYGTQPHQDHNDVHQFSPCFCEDMNSEDDDDPDISFFWFSFGCTGCSDQQIRWLWPLLFWSNYIASTFCPSFFFFWLFFWSPIGNQGRVSANQRIDRQTIYLILLTSL